MRIITKAKNTSEHEYNQRYGQSNQSDQSNAINDTARAIRLKQYDQQYNQDKPGGSNGFIASSIYAKTRNLSKKPDVQEVDVER